MSKSHLDVTTETTRLDLLKNHSSYFKTRIVWVLFIWDKTIARLLSPLLFVFFSAGECFWILRYHITENCRIGQTDAARVAKPLWNVPALKRSSWELQHVGKLTTASSVSPGYKVSQQWGSLSRNAIIYAYYSKWQEWVLCQRSYLMSSRYMLVMKQGTNLDICRSELSAFNI